MNNFNFYKKTVYRFLNRVLFTKEEYYTEKESECDPITVNVNQEYYKKEFDVNKGKDDDKLR